MIQNCPRLGDHQVGNWHLICQHSSLYLWRFVSSWWSWTDQYFMPTVFNACMFYCLAIALWQLLNMQICYVTMVHIHRKCLQIRWALWYNMIWSQWCCH